MNIGFLSLAVAAVLGVAGLLSRDPGKPEERETDYSGIYRAITPKEI